ANQAQESIVIEEALHSYFRVGDARQAEIKGLANCKYFDKTDGYKEKEQTDPVIMLTADTDRPYVDTEAAVEIADPVFKR
ncbi:hypothetical protein ABTD59_19020, partial [Acinetobacter baumannii]